MAEPAPCSPQLPAAASHEPESTSGHDQVDVLLPERKTALQLQFEALQLGQHASDFPAPERTSSPSHQFQPNAAYSIRGATSGMLTPEQRCGAYDDAQATPESPDSLRSSSVFVSGALERRQQPMGMEQSQHGLVQPLQTLVNHHVRAGRSSSASWRQQGTLAQRSSGGGDLSGGAFNPAHISVAGNSSGGAETLASSQPGLPATFPSETLPDYTSASLSHHRHVAQQSHLDTHGADALLPSESDAEGAVRPEKEKEPFSLSQLAAAQHEADFPPDSNKPTEERQSGGGIAWALEVPCERPFSRNSRAQTSREGSSRVCGRKSGHIAAASIHGSPLHVSGYAGKQNCTETALEPIPRKPSTAALLRRLTRKKPSVRQILGKEPQPHNGLLGRRQVCTTSHIFALNSVRCSLGI